MSHVVYLRVRDVDADDYDRLVVRINESDKPKGIRWGQYIDISLDERHWVTAKVEPSGLTGRDKIYIHHRLRGVLNRDADRNRAALLGEPTNFYIRKAPFWKEPFYIMQYHPDDRVRVRTRLKFYWSLLKAAVVIMECYLVVLYSVY